MSINGIIDSEVLTLVDSTGNVPFRRRYDYNNAAGTTVVTDTTLDGVTPYVIVGSALIPELVPLVMAVPSPQLVEANFLELAGIGTATWSPPANTNEVSVTVLSVSGGDVANNPTLQTTIGTSDLYEGETVKVGGDNMELDGSTFEITKVHADNIIHITYSINQ